jgi:pimeloyl-ACP methyl ester carboxylesterase
MRSLIERTTGKSQQTGDEPAAGSPRRRCARGIVDNPKAARLDDGGLVGYADCGDPDGDPLVLCHGFPNSRVFGALFDPAARDLGIRVVAPERPGIGVSDPDPDRELTDWPTDLAAVTEALDLDRFGVLGISGGAPYALVSAAMLPGLVERVGVASGLGPMAAVGLREQLWYKTARHLSPLTKLALLVGDRRARKDRDAFLSGIADGSAPADHPLWTGEVGTVIYDSMIEARRRHGLDPLVRETAIYGSPWGFDLDEVDVPVALWYGKADSVVPPGMGWYLSEHLPTATAQFYPDLGHLSTFVRHESEILRTVARA